MAFSFNASTREVLEQVVREPRFQKLTQLPLFAPQEILLALSAFALFFVGTWLYVTEQIGFVWMLVINSIGIYASFTPLHDATHRSVSRSRFINDAIGTICCLLLLPGITTRIYRYLHLEHHRYTGNAEKDPDEPFVSAPKWLLPFVLSGLDVLWTTWYLKHWATRPLNERIEFALCLCFYIGLHVVFLTSAYAWEFIFCFMIPQRFGLFYVAWFFAHIQHPEGVEWEDAPFQTTVRVETNPVARGLLLGQAFHCLHHLAPSIPFYRYKPAWEIGAHLFERQNVPTRTLWRPSADLVLPEAQAQSWLKARVASIENIATDVRLFELVPENQELWPTFEAGAHIDVGMKQDLIRQYSLCNNPADTQRYCIAVKQDKHSRGGSAFMHSSVIEGTQLDISTPRNNFPLNVAFSHVVLIAAGIGLTPLLAMAHELHARHQSFELHVFARSNNELPFHKSLRDLPFFDAITLRVHNHQTDRHERLEQAIKTHAKGDGMYLCGPTDFMSTVIQISEKRGWSPQNIFSETFVPSKIDASQNAAFDVKIASSGDILRVEAQEQLIDVLHRNGYPVMCSCTQGICGSCITPVLEGVPEHRDAIMSDAQREANDTMTVCVSRSRSQLLVLDL